MSKEKKEKCLQKAESSEISLTGEYAQTLAGLKRQIQEAKLKAAISLNQELLRLYWTIGKTIIDKQENSGWGTKLIERLAKDLKDEFPDEGGFSRTNVFRMRAFYLAYSNCLTAAGQLDEDQIKVVFNIPWGHNLILLDKLKSCAERLWYANKTIENGWSRSILTIWIENDLYNREGKAITNFKNTLPLPDSDLAQQVTKDPYVFNFLSLEEKFRERELEQGLIDHIQNLLMEFGRGFAFIGRQCELVLDDREFLVDLLFYHVVLHCYVVVELKTVRFEPEFAGKMNFYLGAVDRLLKKENDNPSIGLILCKSKSKIEVEVALQDINKPIGVSDYVLAIEKGIPKELVSSLPTIEEIEAELGEIGNDTNDHSL
jgi:predicted nuclease of restriction endonuclease-like (RecB) superfamily